MNILFNCLTMEKGGAERVISNLANHFSEENNVTILTLKKSNDAYKLRSSVRRLCVDKTNYKLDNSLKRRLRKISIGRFITLRKRVIEIKPDIIISFLPEPSIRLMIIKKYSRKIRNIPTIISIRTDPVMEYRNPIIMFIVKKLYRDVDGMVYQTEDAKKFFKNIISTKNQVIIQNPVDNRMLLDPRPDDRRKNVLISVGRLEKTKNHELTIRAFDDSLKSIKHDYILEIYGEGSQRKSLQALIDRLELRSRVFLRGQIDNVPQKLNSSKIYVFSSLYEGMPNSLIEAMAMGLPCIATDCPCGGPRSLIRDGKNGILIKNNDKEALSRAIIGLLKDEKLRKKLSKNAVKIRESNSIDVIIEKWNLCIKNAAKGKA